ncbi:dipeptidase [Dehalobacterium formicoaceticum]|uniref:Dipeptidase n=1 Tax=Dehalobacterium formicoaceticum TaxID=51515 RepID=A0ABT1Y4X5_9FIRM|nr:dipeptidase [Dehalobacterium formicoaceticum]MCR6545927.1 dipeptidase [Dehalobacterium formicoaceticum]
MDGHCDSILKTNEICDLFDLGSAAHLDFKRALANVNLQIFAAYIDSSYKPFQSLQQGLILIEKFHQAVEQNQEQVKLVCSQEDLATINQKDILHALLAVEGGEILCGRLPLLHLIFRLGVRSIGLTWNQRNEIADGCGESVTKGGLTSFGTLVVQEMNKLGMVIDLAHIAPAGFWDVLEHTHHPVMVSHGNCHGLYPHRRNLNDDQIKALAQNDGVMGITFVPDFLGAGDISIEHVIEHIDYAVSLAGPDHVGLGSDFDGTETMPRGLEDVTKISCIGEELLKKGYPLKDVEKIMGGNFIRLFKTVLPQS